MAPRAIILAAGRGLRLAAAAPAEGPKCLLRFGGRTLLERHLRLLHAHGVDDVVITTGYRHEQVDAELDRLALPRRPSVLVNDRYELGSVLTVHVAAPWLTAGGDVLLMDADVLYDGRMLAPLLASRCRNALLVDRDFEAGDEPVKVLLRGGVPVDLAKRPDPRLPHETVGESVGFFRLGEQAARHLTALVRIEIKAGRADRPHEDALRSLLRSGRHRFAALDVTGAPWTEIDFPQDVDRARHDVLPLLDAVPVKG